MISERKFMDNYFTEREVTRQRSKDGDRYVAMVEGRWDLTYLIDPYDESKLASLEMDLGLMPFDEGKRLKSLRAVLNWNHASLRRNGYGAVLTDDGSRVVLRRYIANAQIEEKQAKINLSEFIEAGRALSEVFRGANDTPPENVRYL